MRLLGKNFLSNKKKVLVMYTVVVVSDSQDLESNNSTSKLM